ncbi:MAG: BatD family protein [SAR324 cluster bacterium]|nr:BatD family protein [SAR324 cluster bacterium]
MLRPLIIFLLIALVPNFGFSQISVTANIQSERTFLGESINYQLKIDGVTGGIEIQMPNIKYFTFKKLGPPSRSSQTTIINGKRSSFSGLIYTYALTPVIAGTFEIPSLKIIISGKNYFTQSFRLTVVDPRKLEGRQTIALTQKIVKKSYYLGERISLALSLSYLEEIQEYNFGFPLLESGVSLDLVTQQNNRKSVQLTVGNYQIPFFSSREVINGEEWKVLTQNFSFFPAQIGRFAIEPATIAAKVQRGSDYQRDFFGRVVQVPKLIRQFTESSSLVLDILPLPKQKKPNNFSGAVGQYSLELKSQFESAQVGELFSLTLILKGTGQLEQVTMPSLESLAPNFAHVQNWSAPEVEKDKATFKVQIKAEKVGELEIPSLAFSYFDPETHSYQIARSLPVAFKATEIKKLDLDQISDNRKGLEAKQEKIAIAKLVGEDWHFTNKWFVLYLFLPLIYFFGGRFMEKKEVNLGVDLALDKALANFEELKREELESKKILMLLELVVFLRRRLPCNCDLELMQTELEAARYAGQVKLFEFKGKISEVEKLLLSQKRSSPDTSAVA